MFRRQRSKFTMCTEVCLVIPGSLRFGYTRSCWYIALKVKAGNDMTATFLDGGFYLDNGSVCDNCRRRRRAKTR